MGFKTWKELKKMRKAVKALTVEVHTLTQQADDRAGMVAATQRLKDSGEALQAKVDANPAPAPT